MKYILINDLNTIDIKKIHIKTNNKFAKIYYRLNDTIHIKGIPFTVNICDYHEDYYKYYLKLSGFIEQYNKLVEINNLFEKLENYNSFISVINNSTYIIIEKNQYIIKVFEKIKNDEKIDINLNIMGIKLASTKPLIHIV